MAMKTNKTNNQNINGSLGKGPSVGKKTDKSIGNHAPEEPDIPENSEATSFPLQKEQENNKDTSSDHKAQGAFLRDQVLSKPTTNTDQYKIFSPPVSPASSAAPANSAAPASSVPKAGAEKPIEPALRANVELQDQRKNKSPAHTAGVGMGALTAISAGTYFVITEPLQLYSNFNSAFSPSGIQFLESVAIGIGAYAITHLGFYIYSKATQKTNRSDQ